ncbi:site-specific integrase [Marinihelvus fidelis]|uniref:Site-specific integrase n=1 Tax=Marinihelvus fidelis TaxID=2613842 RepID=A0A5N0T7L3_9GAMM|nr:site-specific integrase [Marinihelvus fidelis]KAA9130882.1 site-specific integrase [Marinihelvus fidelis]
MSLFKRGETWWVRFTAPNGRRIRQSARTTDKRLAQEYEDTLKARLWREIQLGEKPRRTWQEAVVQWLREKQHKADIRQDRSKLRWLDSHLANHYLDEIDRETVFEIGETKRLESSPTTANRYLALIRSILRIARDEWEWLDHIPRVKLYPEPRRRVRWLTHQQAARLLTELPTHLADLATFTLATGLRQRNASFLRWEQVDLRRGMAWVHADESKSGKAIVVPLNDDALEVLRRRHGEHPDYVFTYNGAPVARTTTKAWYKALDRAGISDFRWHDLRHTWASWHVQAGTSLQELQELGGWSCQEMVLRYAHLGGEHLKRASRRIEGTNLAQDARQDHLRLIASR